MNNLFEKIILIYPELKNFDFAFGPIELRDNSDGNGPYIHKWEHPSLEMPTKSQLENAK